MLDTRVGLNVRATLADPLDLGSVGRVALQLSKAIELATGTGASQADELWFDERVVPAASEDDLDLAGTLVNGLGQTVNFARVKGVVIAPAPGNIEALTVGGAPSNAWDTWVGDATDTVVVRPGGLLVLIAPDAAAYPVTAGTGDILRIANADVNAAAYEIVLFGATA